MECVALDTQCNFLTPCKLKGYNHILLELFSIFPLVHQTGSEYNLIKGNFLNLVFC